MRTMTLLAGLALAIGALLPGNALSAARGTDLPFKGSGSGYATVNLMTGQAQVPGTGTFTHFGLTTGAQALQVVPTGPGTVSLSGTWTFTAANGDQMFGTASGTARFTDAVHSTSHLTYTSSGGTGRFADASLTAEGTSHGTRVSVEGGIATDFYEATLVGQLTY